MSHRVGVWVVAVGLGASAAGAARAQHPGHLDAGGMQAAVLTNRGVQRELKLDGGQADKVAGLAAGVVARGREAAKGFADLPEAERRERMHAAMIAICDEALAKLRGLLSAEQYGRYEQIALQQRGILAFADPAIREKLKLTGEQDVKIHDIARGLHDRARVLSGDPSPGRMAEVHEQGMALHREAMEEAVSTLTPGQKATLRGLTGPRFEVKFEARPRVDQR